MWLCYCLVSDRLFKFARGIMFTKLLLDIDVIVIQILRDGVIPERRPSMPFALHRDLIELDTEAENVIKTLLDMLAFKEPYENEWKSKHFYSNN